MSMTNCLLSGVLFAALTLTKSVADSYRVYDWQGKPAPTKPTEGPPGLGAVTHTAYLNGGQYRNGNALTPMDVEISLTVEAWSNPMKWRVDPEGFLSGGNLANYGYQSPDEAEFSFGDSAGQVVMVVDFRFSQPVSNPSFLLMDIDNNGSDHGSLFLGRRAGGEIVYPTMSLVAGSTVAWTGSGPTLDVFSNGGPSMDNQAAGSAFFEWRESDVTSISFQWESSPATAIRMSNLYAEYDPAGFFFAVPEPSGPVLILLSGFGLLLRRRH